MPTAKRRAWLYAGAINRWFECRRLYVDPSYLSILEIWLLQTSYVDDVFKGAKKHLKSDDSSWPFRKEKAISTHFNPSPHSEVRVGFYSRGPLTALKNLWFFRSNFGLGDLGNRACEKWSRSLLRASDGFIIHNPPSDSHCRLAACKPTAVAPKHFLV